MQRERFRDSPVGRLVRITGTDGRTGEAYDHVAFQPDPLGPSEPPLPGEVWRTVARAGRALGRLHQASQQVPEPALLRPTTLRTEAQSTSALEGTFAPLEDVLAADVTQESGRSDQLREVINYVTAAEAAYDWVDDGRPITVSSLCEVHRLLMHGTSLDGPESGRIRQIQVAIGSPGGSIETARFIPPPPGLELEADVSDLVRWMNADALKIDPVVAAAMTHYQFETLHPFHDGNGRIGRLLVVLQLCSRRELAEPLLTISPWLEARRSDYQEMLGRVSASGDWAGWTEFFATGLAESCEQTVRIVDGLLALQESFVDRLRGAGLTGGLIRDIADRLIGGPFVTVRSMQTATGRSAQAVNRAIGQLVELGILVERTGGTYARLFEAAEVAKVLRSR